MTAHELARILLSHSDVPVCVSVDVSGPGDELRLFAEVRETQEGNGVVDILCDPLDDDDKVTK